MSVPARRQVTTGRQASEPQLRLLGVAAPPLQQDPLPTLSGAFRQADENGHCFVCGSPLRRAGAGLLVCRECGAELEELEAA